MTYTARACTYPFINVILKCDECSTVESGDGSQVVSVSDGRTICKTCQKKELSSLDPEYETTMRLIKEGKIDLKSIPF